MSKPWKEWKKKELYKAFAEERSQRADVQDALDDVLDGLERWKEHKMAGMILDTDDEMLMRWVEAGPAKNVTHV